MTDEARKVLTEFLGETLHSYPIFNHDTGHYQCECGYETTIVEHATGHWGNHQPRTFNTAQDMVDLARAISKHGKKWGQFEHYIETAWMHDTSYDDTYEAEWLLIDPERFCQLVYDSEVWR